MEARIGIEIRIRGGNGDGDRERGGISQSHRYRLCILFKLIKYVF